MHEPAPHASLPCTKRRCHATIKPNTHTGGLSSLGIVGVGTPDGSVWSVVVEEAVVGLRLGTHLGRFGGTIAGDEAEEVFFMNENQSLS